MTKQDYCSDCEQDFTSENTKEFGGFDEGNYRAAGRVSAEWFTKCDSCFWVEVDNHCA